MRLFTRAAVIAALIGSGCGGGGGTGTLGDTAGGGTGPDTPIVGDGPGPVVGNEDVTTTALSVAEQDITAQVVAGALQVRLPVMVEQNGARMADARVLLADLEGTVLAEVNESVELLGGDNMVEVSVTSDALPAAGVDEASYLVAYEVSVGGKTASGYRSLFTVLPKVDLRAQLPSKLIADEGAQLRIFAIDPFTSQPMAGIDIEVELAPAPVEVEERDDGGVDGPPIPAGETTTLTTTTGDDGSAVVELPATGEGDYIATARAVDGLDIMGFLTDDVSVERSHRVLLSTDKPIYQPGQTMHLRALAMKQPSLVAEAGRDVTFEVYDGKGNMVMRRFEETNAFGIAATDFKIAAQVNMGDYQVKTLIGDALTTKTVAVKRYVLPKFKVATSLNAPFYLAGESVHGVLNVDYFFGKPVAGGQVTVTATLPEAGGAMIGTASGTTSPEGIYDFEMELPADVLSSWGEAEERLVSFDIAIVDGAGNTVETTAMTLVAASPVDIAAVAESGAIVPGVHNQVFLFATDPLNRPLDAALTVTADGEPVEVEMLGEGVGRIGIVPDGSVVLGVVAVVAEGDSGTEHITLDPSGSSAALLLRTDQSLYNAGDSMTVSVFTATNTQRAFVDLIKDGQTMLTDAIDVVDGVGTLAIDLDAGLVGDVTMSAYAVADDGTIARETKVIFVRDARGLSIDVSTGKSTYAPGEEATIDFQVTDDAGEPAVAALGVQIVDEAVFAVSDNKPGLLETYFLASEALQAPPEGDHEVPIHVPTLIGADATDEEAQAKAGASFASMVERGDLGLASSWADVKGEVNGALSPAFASHAAEIAEQLDVGEFDPWDYDSGAAEALTQQIAEREGEFFDFWGNAYRLGVADDWDGLYLTVASNGLDEREGTWDDWNGTVAIMTYEWPMAAADGAMDDGEMAGGGGDWDANSPMPEDSSEGGGEPRVRKDFPETLYFNPSLVTDDDGHASVTLNMADSITEWRVSTLGNTAGGALGSTTGSVTVFQDFFVDVSFPPTLTQNDTVEVPVAVYNYLPVPTTVSLQLETASWFEATGGTTMSVDVAPGEVTAVRFPVKVVEVGWHALTVTGLGDTMSDAVQRVVQVLPDGQEERESVSGVLDGEVTHEMPFPALHIPNSHELLLKIYPGIMAQAVEGLDSLLQQPSGCFEQTTATNWPNTLVIDYLRGSGQSSPEIELKALDYLEQGYQRLLTFECTGGGFVWFGDPAPANVVLSAMGVMEFADMAKVIEVDPAVIERTANWVIAAQQPDGRWTTNQGSEFATVQYDDTKTTGWTAWALAQSPFGAEAVSQALDYLAPAAKDAGTDVYSLAMMANAYAVAEPSSSRTQQLLDRLADAVTSEDGVTHWVYDGSSQNYGGGGSSTSIEVTALAVMAFISSGTHSDLIGSSIGWMAGNKDSFGNWGTTHATILSLRAMVMSMQNKTEEGEGTVTIRVDGDLVETLEVTEVNRNVFHQIDLRGDIAPDAGQGSTTAVTVGYEGTGNLMYQLVGSWWMPHEPAAIDPPITLSVVFEETDLGIGDITTVVATVVNTTADSQDMPMLEIGLPPGASVHPEKLDQAVAEGTVLSWERRGQSVVVYGQQLTPGQPLVVSADVQAGMAIAAKARPSAAYLYYDTATRADVEGVTFSVTDE